MSGLSDEFGNSQLPIYVLNVTYPLIPEEVQAFCRGKRAVLIVEEGQPEFIEHELNTLIRRADGQTRVVGKAVLPRAGEYTGPVLQAGIEKFLKEYSPGTRRAFFSENPACGRAIESPRCRSGRRASAPDAPSGRFSRR